MLLLIAGAASIAAALDLPPDVLVETTDDIERLLQQGEIDGDTAEALAALLDRPLDLNHASRRQLRQLPGIDRALADAIVALRQRGSVDLDTLVRTGTLSPDEALRLRPFVAQARSRARWHGSQGLRTLLARSQIPAVWQRLEGTGDGRLRRIGLLWQLQRTTWQRVGTDGADIVVTAPPLQPRPTRYGIDVAGHGVRVLAGTWAMRPGQGLAFAVGHPREGEAELELGLRPEFRRVPDCRRRCQRATLVDPPPLTALRGLVVEANMGVLDLHIFGADTVESIPPWSVTRADNAATSVTFRQQLPDRTAVELQRSLPLLREQLLGIAASHEQEGFRAGCLSWVARPRWRVALPLKPTAAARQPPSSVWGAGGCWTGLTRSHLEFDSEVAVSITSQTGAAATLRLGAEQKTTWELQLWHYGDRWDNPHSGAPASPLQHDGVRGRGESGARLNLRKPGPLQLRHRSEFAWHRLTSRWRTDNRTTLSVPVKSWTLSVGAASRLLTEAAADTDWRIEPFLRLVPGDGVCRIEMRWPIDKDARRTQTPTAIAGCASTSSRSVRVQARLLAGARFPTYRPFCAMRTSVAWRHRHHRIRTGPDLQLELEDTLDVRAWWTFLWEWAR